MDGVRIRLADGTVFEGGTAGLSGGSLWLYVSGDSMPALAAVFCDDWKTNRIVFEYGEMAERYEGYTDCRVISIEDNGRASVCMKKPAAEANNQTEAADEQ